ncbi:DNA repair protein RecN [candidate division KSB1 bacterium 4484_87]|nr:MAG: DNA repair protein RecN [candidate division KSB1 bacterium 4484_87]
MLKSLHVENFALIDKIDIEFGSGLNIITGETGAGKSILIDALGSALGEKIPADALRKGTRKAITECLFSIGHLQHVLDFMEQNSIDNPDNALILRKESSETGRNRAFVNDTPFPNATLEQLGEFLVDLHGQHEHQALLKVKYHIQYLDDFGGYSSLLQKFSEEFHKFIHLREELHHLLDQEKQSREKRDLYQFQLKEINQIDPVPGEEEELIQEEKLLGNSEKRYQLSAAAANELYEAETSVYDRLSRILEMVEELAAIDPELAPIRHDCESAQVATQEIGKFLQSYSQSIEINPDRLNEIRERLGSFSLLKRKYQRSIEEIVQYKQQIEQELHLIENLDEVITQKNAEIEQQREILSHLCLELSEKRTQTAKKLESVVQAHLAELGMKNARFKVSVTQTRDEKGAAEINGVRMRTTERGVDHVEFFMAANPGEDLKPLIRVASGGEISRIMLALKSSLAIADRIPVLIFDEIDIGISGRIAQSVGLALKKLAQTHQIICITHLPQIASMADNHFVVEKTSTNETTTTGIRKLSADEHIYEIAKLLGGETVSEAHINSARELIEEAHRLATETH